MIKFCMLMLVELSHPTDPTVLRWICLDVSRLNVYLMGWKWSLSWLLVVFQGIICRFHVSQSVLYFELRAIPTRPGTLTGRITSLGRLARERVEWGTNERELEIGRTRGMLGWLFQGFVNQPYGIMQYYALLTRFLKVYTSHHGFRLYMPIPARTCVNCVNS